MMKAIITQFCLFLFFATCFADTVGRKISAPQHQLKKISPHAYVYAPTGEASPANSFGANAEVIVGDKSVMVVDTLTSAKEGRGLLNAVRKLTNKPIKYVANTHYHLDHALGNCVFAREGAIIIAHENVRKSLKRTAMAIQKPESYGMTKEDFEGTTLVEPDICFAERMYVDLGGIVVELFYPGASHNDSSIAAYIKKDNVLFTGDMLFNKCHPFIGEGDLDSWLNVLDEIAKLNASVIVPGHGPLANKQDIKDMKEYIKQFDILARKLCKGKKLKDSSNIAVEMIKQLPDQKRDQLKMLVEMNLKFRYLKPH